MVASIGSAYEEVTCAKEAPKSDASSSPTAYMSLGRAIAGLNAAYSDVKEVAMDFGGSDENQRFIANVLLERMREIVDEAAELQATYNDGG